MEEAFKHYFKCYSVRKVYTHLLEQYGDADRPFNKVDRLFKNEKYCSRWCDNPQYCESYITPEQFEKIRSVKNSRTFTISGDAYIFAGLIICPLCGRHYTDPRHSRKFKNGSYSKRKQYRCTPKYNRPGGHMGGTPILTEKYVEKYMLEHVVKKLNEEVLKAEKRAIQDKSKTELSPAAI